MTNRLKTWSLLAYFVLLIPSFTFSQESHFILAIGDSHGESETGWVNQLRKLRPTDSILNVAISGNTIGFDNLGKESLNELRNIRLHLTEAKRIYKKVDYIIVLLGTNDCKAIFDSLQHEVPRNLESLMQILTTFKFEQQNLPRVLLATPPPIDEDEKLELKYLGSSNRLKELLPYYESVARKYHCVFINTHDHLSKIFPTINKDGIHLTEKGYKRIADLINQNLN